ncbi:MAG: hypothetical protein ABSF69_17815 [Polyangiaceae bacterium]|jgi:hypothetical protein
MRVNLDHVFDAIVRRMAREIVVWAQRSKHGLPYVAGYDITASPDGVPDGHPHALLAEADTPEHAVEGVISQMYCWVRTPRSPLLVRSTEHVRTKAPGLVPVPQVVELHA